MPGRKFGPPKRGDKQLKAGLFEEMMAKQARNDRLTISGGELSSGPSGTAIIIPEQDPAPSLRLIEHDALPASFGSAGFFYKQLYAFSPSGLGPQDSVEAANVPPHNERKAYPRLQGERWAFDSQAMKFYRDGSRNVQLINPFGLPLGAGLSWCSLVDATTNPETWVVVTPSSVDPWGMVDVKIYAPIDGPYNWDFKHLQRKLVRGYIPETASGGSGENQYPGIPRWYFIPGQSGSPPGAHNGDVMLIYPGVWDVSFGFAAQAISSGDPLASRQVTSTAANTAPPTAHTHPVTVYHPPRMGMKVHVNFNPDEDHPGPVSNPEGSYSRSDELWLTCPYAGTESQPYGRVVTGEKRFRLSSDRQPWHGQPHTRLSLGVKADVFEYDIFSPADRGPSLRLISAWITIRPTAAVDGPFYWPGANVFPNGYNIQGRLDARAEYTPEGQINAGYQWWGAGDEPKLIDENGDFVLP